MIPVVVIDFAGVAESSKEKLSIYTEKLIKGSNRNVWQNKENLKDLNFFESDIFVAIYLISKRKIKTVRY